MSLGDTLLQWWQFMSRVALGVMYLSIGSSYILHGNFAAYASRTNQFGNMSLDGKLAILSGFLCVVSVWLLLGIRSRVVAAMGCVAILAVNLGSEVTNGPSFSPLLMLLIFVLTVPVIAGGGGKFALYRRGWQDLA